MTGFSYANYLQELGDKGAVDDLREVIGSILR